MCRWVHGGVEGIASNNLVQVRRRQRTRVDKTTNDRLDSQGFVARGSKVLLTDQVDQRQAVNTRSEGSQHLRQVRRPQPQGGCANTFWLTSLSRRYVGRH